MSEEKPREAARGEGAPDGRAAKAERLAREAEALRANLHRRKQQARERARAGEQQDAGGNNSD